MNPTPNREYNLKWETLPADKFRHRDHRFEWTRAEFPTWAKGVATRFGYSVRFLPVGPEDSAVGLPTQLGVFQKKPTWIRQTNTENVGETIHEPLTNCWEKHLRLYLQ